MSEEQKKELSEKELQNVSGGCGEQKTVEKKNASVEGTMRPFEENDSPE
ncbi:MAG: bacteriocin [Parasporobacterium sp.]|nr:bacteriocin [Parasporobacterium sp.]